MASAKVIKKLREEATCAICLELMTEPVIIDCGHIYCRACIVALIEKKSSETSSLGTFLCPQCQEPFKSDSLQPNKQLENIIDTIKETNQERLCEEHGEKLQLFCENDGQLICWCCERSAQHQGHVTALVDVAYQGYREKLQKAVTKLKDTEATYTGLKVDTTQKISSWEEKVKQEKERIHTEFTDLHTLLHQEEEFFMCRLEEEREQKLSWLQEDIDHLENTLQKLKNHILELDQKSQCSAHDLLQDVKGTLSRSSAINLETPDDVSLEIQTVCHVAELHLSAKKILKRSEGPRVSKCRALYQYVGKDMSQLSFHKNNVIEILQEDPSGWWLGRLEGRFPATYTLKI